MGTETKIVKSDIGLTNVINLRRPLVTTREKIRFLIVVAIVEVIGFGIIIGAMRLIG
jgi:hypothetical protein